MESKGSQHARIVAWSLQRSPPEVEAFLRRPAFERAAERTAAAVLADVRARGDAAVADAALRFDGVSLSASELPVSTEEWDAAEGAVSPSVRRAIRLAHGRITRFAAAGLRRDWTLRTRGGGSLGERFQPLDRVGVYVPGGAAPLVSTALMTATLAHVAGVPEIVACTPCGRDKRVHPALLYALRTAGATEVYRVGGIQAIGLMAWGSASVRPVQKIVGPGGAHVTAAKRLVYGHVALDLVAGPSEIAVLADRSARPAWVAADLLSQAEHGTGRERALLVTDAADLAQAVRDEIEWQIPQLSRADRIRRMLPDGILLAVVPDLAQGVELCNRFAPEHLELMVARPRAVLPRVRAAGAVFVGPWTPESAGDFVAGPSHVLPTGGAARMFSGLTVEDFRRRSSVIEFSREDLEESLTAIQSFGAVEGLDGHARAAALRCGGNARAGRGRRLSRA